MKFKRQKEERSRQPADSGVSSLFKSGNTLNSGRLQQIEQRRSEQEGARRQTRRRKYFFHLILGFVVVAVIFYLFASRITAVKIENGQGGNLPADISDVYSTAILSDLNSNWLNSFQPFVPVGHITSQLLDKYPAIQNITVHNNGFSKTLLVKLDFRKPVLIWQTRNSGQFYLDNDGVAFENNYTNEDTSKLIQLVDTSGLGAAEGKTIASSQLISFVIKLHNQLQLAKIPVRQYSIPSTLREVDVQLQGQPYIIKFLSTNDVGQETAQLTDSLKYFSQHPDQTPSKYLDLRLIGRAYYQ